MPKLYEIISAQSIDAVRPYLQRALDTIGMDGLERNRTDRNIYLFNQSGYYRITEDGHEAGPLLVATIHNFLLGVSVPDPEAPKPFTHQSTMPISRVVSRVFPTLPPDHNSRLAGEVSRILRAHNLVQPVTQSTRVWVRAVGADYNMGYKTVNQAAKATKAFLTRKDEAHMVKREAEELAKQQPVISRFTIPSVPTEPSPEAILDWARRTKEAFDRLNTRYNALLDEHAEVVEKLKKLEGLEEVQQWKEVGQGLAEIMKEGRDNGSARSPEVHPGLADNPKGSSGPFSR